MSWDMTVPKQAKIEKDGFNRIKHLLDKHLYYTLYKQDTVEQVKGKVDGHILLGDKKAYIEFKFVRGEYQNIYGEYKGISRDTGSEYDGWIVNRGIYDDSSIFLFYVMLNTVHVFNLNKLKKWYAENHSTFTYPKHTYYDKALNQDMHAYLIPIKDIEKFRIFVWKI